MAPLPYISHTAASVPFIASLLAATHSISNSDATVYDVPNALLRINFAQGVGLLDTMWMILGSGTAFPGDGFLTQCRNLVGVEES
jgi:hypothetical protein